MTNYSILYVNKPKTGNVAPEERQRPLYSIKISITESLAPGQYEAAIYEKVNKESGKPYLGGAIKPVQPYYKNNYTPKPQPVPAPVNNFTDDLDDDVPF